MKVLFCTSKFSVVDHGPAKFAQLIADLPDYDNSIDLRILTEDSVNESNYRYFKIRSQWFLTALGMLIKPWRYYLNARKLRHQFSFDTIVFNHGMLSIVSSVFFNKKVNVIAMVNDDNSSSLTLLRPTLKKRWLRYYVFKIIEKWACKLANLVIVNSNYLNNELIRSYKLKPTKVKTLYKGLDFANIKVSRRKWGNNDTIHVLFVKSDFERGGLIYLVRALGQLRKYHFKLIIIGPNLLTDLNIMSNIEIDFRRKRNQKEVYECLLNETDIFCVPSLKEGLGVANLEAMAHQVPVVSTNVGGIPEVTSNGKLAWLAEPGDPYDLAIQLRYCIVNKTEREDKIRRGKCFVEENFNKQIVLENFSRILLYLDV